jgi:LysM repeat protein
VTEEQRRRLARVGAPAAFLLAFTIFVLVVRSGAQEDDAGTTTTATATAPATTQQAPPATTQAPATTAAETETTAGEIYVIQSGDTLETVAAEHGTTVDALVELNPGIDPRALTIGQEIRVR